MGGFVFLVLFLLLLYFAVLGLGIANYVLTSLSLHKIAERRQIKNPWLAWLPYANYWIIGSIADDYDARLGHNRKWRVIMLSMSLSFVGAFMVSYIGIFVSLVSIAIQSAEHEPEPGVLIATILPLYLLLILAMIVAMALQACHTVCLFKIYESTVPEKAVKYFLLSLLVPFASAFCLYKCREQGYSNAPVQPYAYAQPTAVPASYPPVADAPAPLSPAEDVPTENE